jgi:hypothetical protein
MAKTSFISTKVKKVVRFVFNNNVKNICLAIILICIVVIIILNREPTKILLHISSIFLSNGVGLLIIKKTIDNYGEQYITNRFLIRLLNELNGRFTKLYIICFVIGGIALFAFILMKLMYKRGQTPTLAEITKASVPNYVTDPNSLTNNSQIYPNESLDSLNNMGKK